MKVLVLTASYGHGHRMAARALEDALRTHGVEVVVVDTVSLSRVEKVWAWLYAELSDWGHYLWLGIYEMGRSVPASVRSTWVGLFRRNLLKVVRETRPDVVVSTHFLGGDVMTWLKRHRQGRSPRVLQIITDYEPHPAWLSPGVDLYVAPTHATRLGYIRLGAPPDQIVDAGIPLRKEFVEIRVQDPRDLRSRVGLDPHRFTVLMTAGAMGTTPIEKFFPLLHALRDRTQWVVFAGRNRRLQERLKQATRKAGMKAHILGFVEHPAPWVQMSDVVVSKGGGLTVAESLALGKPLLLIHPIPGQEQGNARFIQRSGAGYYLKKKEELPQLIAYLLDNPDWYDRLASRARALGRPEATRAVLDAVLTPLSR